MCFVSICKFSVFLIYFTITTSIFSFVFFFLCNWKFDISFL